VLHCNTDDFCVIMILLLLMSEEGYSDYVHVNFCAKI